MTIAPPWHVIEGGIAIRVRVTPRAAKNSVVGTCETPDGPSLQVKVRALPAEGAANAAVEKLIADWLGIAKTSVKLHSGPKSRVKLLHVLGDASTLVEGASSKLQKTREAS